VLSTLSHPIRIPQENDRCFGVISRKAKKANVIGSSQAWMRLARRSKQPNYHVMWMEREGFRDWKKFLGVKYRRPSSRWINTDGEIVPLMKVRWFNYGVGESGDGALVQHPDEVWYRLSLDANEPWKRIALERGARYAGLVSDETYTLYPNPLSLDPKKVPSSRQRHDDRVQRELITVGRKRRDSES
jgi:hypothetical protein